MRALVRPRYQVPDYRARPYVRGSLLALGRGRQSALREGRSLDPGTRAHEPVRLAGVRSPPSRSSCVDPGRRTRRPTADWLRRPRWPLPHPTQAVRARCSSAGLQPVGCDRRTPRGHTSSSALSRVFHTRRGRRLLWPLPFRHESGCSNGRGRCLRAEGRSAGTRSTQEQPVVCLTSHIGGRPPLPRNPSARQVRRRPWRRRGGEDRDEPYAVPPTVDRQVKPQASRE